ncbi:hypothetical protein BGW38_005137 [Lunasporangiospora selenospora]|uniref:Uncharacterized protein n=1 Tax=Lunasporangiospora selenospora TaxID=979761 RepID=A0A9P6KBQ2_9FUNG|nr:hypothetical protein BGW38_005137 [Lunasporangiospora selenospora]
MKVTLPLLALVMLGLLAQAAPADEPTAADTAAPPYCVRCPPPTCHPYCKRNQKCVYQNPSCYCCGKPYCVPWKWGDH